MALESLPTLLESLEKLVTEQVDGIAKLTGGAGVPFSKTEKGEAEIRKLALEHLMRQGSAKSPQSKP